MMYGDLKLWPLYFTMVSPNANTGCNADAAHIRYTCGVTLQPSVAMMMGDDGDHDDDDDDDDDGHNFD